MLCQLAQGIPNCIQQNINSNKEECTLCYRSTLNGSGLCTPITNQITNCLHYDTNNTSKCRKCEPGYHSRGFRGVCVKTQSSSVNKECVDAFSYDNTDLDLRCLECRDGFPGDSDYKCSPWSAAPSSDQPFLNDCLTGYNNATKARCEVCKDGYMMDLTFQKCIKSGVAGCWQSKKGLCFSCRAWDGHFSDGFKATSEGKEVICRTLEQHERAKIEVVRLVDEGWLLRNRSLTEVISEKIFKDSVLTNYAGFKDGFVVVNHSIKNYAIQTVGTKGMKKLDFGLNSSEDLPYSRSNRNYRDGSKWLKCFFFKKMCVVVDDFEIFDKYGNLRRVQEVVLFNATNATYHGAVYRANDLGVSYSNSITNVLPITKSSYIILGFSVDTGSRINSRDPTLVWF